MSPIEIGLPAAIDKIVSNQNKYCFLVGSGLSASTSIPTGPKLCQDLLGHIGQSLGWKASNFDELCAKFREYFQAEDCSYSRILEKALPSRSSRQSYIENLCRDKEPKAHRDLAAVAQNDPRFGRILTTNFDPLIEYALFEVLPRPPDVYSRPRDLPEGLPDQEIPQVAKLHGDYIYVDIANVEADFDVNEITRAIHVALGKRGLIVLGMGSGDPHIKAALMSLGEDNTAYTGGVFWIERRKYFGSTQRELLETLRRSGKLAFAVLVDEEYPPDHFLQRLREALGIRRVDARESGQSRLMRRISSRLPVGITPVVKASEEGETTRTRRPLHQLLAGTSQTVLVLGEAGSGKSTALLWEVKRALEMGQKADYIPIAADKSVEWTGSIEDLVCVDQLEAAKNPMSVIQEAKNSVRESGRVIAAARAEIRPILRLNDTITILFVQPLDDEDREKLVRQELPNKLVQPFMDELKRLEERLGEITRTPLWVSLAASMFRSRNQKLPNSRVEIYDEYVKWFLGPWSRPRTQAGLETLKRIAEDTAYWLEGKGSRPNESDLENLAATGMVRIEGEVEFLHQTFQEYFASRRCLRAVHEAVDHLARRDWNEGREMLGKGIPENIIRSEIMVWLGELISSIPEERKEFLTVLRRLAAETPPQDKRETNMWYAAAMTRETADEFLPLISDRCDRLNGQDRTPAGEAILLNASMAGIYLGDPRSYQTFLEVLDQDFCEDSWSLCQYQDHETPFGHVGYKDKASSKAWDDETKLQELRSSLPFEEKKFILMHIGHRAHKDYNKVLESKDDFRRLAEELLVESIEKKQHFSIPMNAIICLKRIRDKRSLNCILKVARQGDWRILRNAVDAVARFSPLELDTQTCEQVGEFLRFAPEAWRHREPYQVSLVWLIWKDACQKFGVHGLERQSIEWMPPAYRNALLATLGWQ